MSTGNRISDLSVFEIFEKGANFIEYDINHINIEDTLRLLGFTDDNINLHIAYIRNTFLNNPAFGFDKKDYNYQCSNYKPMLTFSIKGFKKLCLVYQDAPNFINILNYLVNM